MSAATGGKAVAAEAVCLASVAVCAACAAVAVANADVVRCTQGRSVVEGLAAETPPTAATMSKILAVAYRLVKGQYLGCLFTYVCIYYVVLICYFFYREVTRS